MLAVARTLFVLFAALLLDHGSGSFSLMRSSLDGRTVGSVHAEFLPGAVRSACCTNLSEGRSSDDVASSRMSTRGSARNARAKATSCRCPEDRRTPRRRTSVS